MKLSLIKTQIKNKHVVEAYERLKDSRNLQHLIFSTLSEFGNLECYSAFINEDNVLQGVLNLMKMVKNLDNQSQRFHGHVVVPELDTLLNSYFQFWIKEPVETPHSSHIEKNRVKKGATVSTTPDTNKGVSVVPLRQVVERYKISNSNETLNEKLVSDQKALHSFTKSETEKQKDCVGSFVDTSQFCSSRIRNRYVLETFRQKKGDALKTHKCLCEWAGVSPEKVHMINFTKALKSVVQKADELKGKDVNQLNSFLKEFFKFPLVAKTKGPEEKTMKESLIKTRIKNKYVMEAYERLKPMRNLKQLIFSSLSDLGNFARYSAFIDEDNVFQGVTNMMEMIKKLQDKRQGSNGVEDLDEFMNSYFQFYIRDRVEADGAMNEDLIENDAALSEDLQVLNEDTSELSMVPSHQVENCCEPSDTGKGTSKENCVSDRKALPSSTKAKRKQKSLAESSRPDHDPSLLYTSSIRIGYVIETFRLKKEDGLKTHDCLCKWEGIAPEKVHVKNFIEAVNSLVRKADELKRTDTALYKSYMREFFKFPLVEMLESKGVQVKGRKLNRKKVKEEERLEKKTEDSPNKADRDTGKKTRKRRANETTHEQNASSENDTQKGKKRTKQSTNDLSGFSGVTSVVTKPKHLTSVPKHSTFRPKPSTSRPKQLRHRTMLSKKKSKQAVLELQLKMKLQYQAKLQHLIKRQNSIIVRQRKQIRALKQRWPGVPAANETRGVQCSLISATPKTVLVRVLKT